MKHQRGGTLMGFIIGLVVGLAVALSVALYITKVPVPFMSKGPSRAAEQDAAEESKNKDWDPNAPLYGKRSAKSAEQTSDLGSIDTKNETKPEAKPAERKDVAVKTDAKSADPLGDLAKFKTQEHKTDSKAPDGDPFMYYVQAGAYRTSDEAEAQRAKLVMMGLEAKVSERDQGGRTVYRVRMGPLSAKADAEGVRERLNTAHVDSVMVRVQR